MDPHALVGQWILCAYDGGARRGQSRLVTVDGVFTTDCGLLCLDVTERGLRMKTSSIYEWSRVSDVQIVTPLPKIHIKAQPMQPTATDRNGTYPLQPHESVKICWKYNRRAHMQAIADEELEEGDMSEIHARIAADQAEERAMLARWALSDPPEVHRQPNPQLAGASSSEVHWRPNKRLAGAVSDPPEVNGQPNPQLAGSSTQTRCLSCSMILCNGQCLDCDALKAAIEKSTHAAFVTGKLLEDLWEFAQQSEPVILKKRGQSFVTQPKLAYGIVNEAGEMPLFRFGFDKQDWCKILSMPDCYMKVCQLIYEEFGVEVNHCLANYFLSGDRH